jgi:hypothetical protein
MKQITDRNRGYNTAADREQGIKDLRLAGWTHFTRYRDTQAEFAVQFGRVGTCKCCGGENLSVDLNDECYTCRKKVSKAA